MRIGLFFSTGAGLIQQSMDLDKLAGVYAADFFIAIYDDFFKTSNLKHMLEDIRINQLEAVLLIGESPLFYQTQRAADSLLHKIEALGINPNKIGYVNLKEQLVMVHIGREDALREKAKLLIDVEIERVRKAEFLDIIPVAPRKSVVIIGATLAAFFTAQQMLQKGYATYIINSEPISWKQLSIPEETLGPLLAYMEDHVKFNLLEKAEINDIYGYAGDYTLKLEIAGAEITVAAGAIVVANSESLEFTNKIRPLLHIDIDEDGYFKPLNRDTLSVYSSEQGIYLVENQENDLRRTVTAAASTAMAVIELLDCDEINHKIAVSEIDTELCGGCGICVKTCLFHACKIDPVENYAVIDTKRCKGCGNCVTSCPTGARDLLTYPQKYLFNAISILSRFKAESEKILMFLCEGCGYRAMDNAALMGLKYPIGVMPLKVRCGGTIDTQLILEAFHDGFDGVIICKCQDGHCSNIVGNVDLDRRANLFREILRSRGIDAERLHIVDALHSGDNRCVQVIEELYLEISKPGGEHCEK